MPRASSGCGTRASSSRQRARCARKSRERAARLRLQLVALRQPGGRGQQRDAEVTGQQMDATEAGRTQAALRDVDDALEGEVVVRLHHQTEVGDGVADFLPLVEARRRR